MKVSDAKTEILIMAKYRQFNVQLNRDSLYYHYKKRISSQIEEATSILQTVIGDQERSYLDIFSTNMRTAAKRRLFVHLSDHLNLRVLEH